MATIMVRGLTDELVTAIDVIAAGEGESREAWLRRLLARAVAAHEAAPAALAAAAALDGEEREELAGRLPSAETIAAAVVRRLTEVRGC